MTEHTTVSVIIPCFNYAEYVATAIESALTTIRAPHEVIVVDDGSTDASPQIIARYPDVRSIRQPNAGVARARNQGLAVATGEFVMFLDADDWLLPGGIDRSVEELQARPECIWLAARYVLAADDGTILERSAPTAHPDDAYAELLRLRRFNIGGTGPCSSVARSSTLSGRGGRVFRRARITSSICASPARSRCAPTTTTFPPTVSIRAPCPARPSGCSASFASLARAETAPPRASGPQNRVPRGLPPLDRPLRSENAVGATERYPEGSGRVGPQTRDRACFGHAPLVRVESRGRPLASTVVSRRSCDRGLELLEIDAEVVRARPEGTWGPVDGTLREQIAVLESR